MAGESGDILGFGLSHPTLSPVSSAGSVTATEAGITATALLESKEVSAFTSETPLKMVVRPNTVWEEGGTVDPVPGPPKVAWVCPFATVDTVYEVYVDISTGNVIGGDIHVSRSSKERNLFPHTAQIILREAR